MEPLDVQFEPSETVEYDVVDNVPVKSPDAEKIKVIRDSVTSDVLRKKLTSLQDIHRVMKFAKRSAMLNEERSARKSRNRKRNKMAKASRKRNRR